MTPLSRRTFFVSGAAFAAALPFSRIWAASEEPGFTFLAVGDWGRQGQYNQKDVATQMGITAEQLKARFIVSTGDNIYPHGVKDVQDPLWKVSFEDIYTAPSLQVPWHVVLGNHDYHGNPQAQVDYSATSHRWSLPARYYSRVEQIPGGGTIEFFMLDTSPMTKGPDPDPDDAGRTLNVEGQDAHAQLAWLDAGLAKSTADWKVVTGHHPIYSEGQHGGTRELQEILDPILKKHRVPLYLNGHKHDLEHFKFGDTHYVCSGAGSKMSPLCYSMGADFCSLEAGFIAVHVSRAALKVAYKDFKGTELRVVTIDRAA